MRHGAAFLFLALAGVAGQGCTRASAQGAYPSPIATRKSIELTVYSGNFGMVRETRPVELVGGRSHIGLQGVSKALDQDSVLFEWPSRKDVRVVSSTYELGTGNSARLLQRFLGREVQLVYRGQDGREGERVRGILEVAEPGNLVVRADGKYIVNPAATIEAPADAGIVTIPQLSAEVESPSAGTTDLGINYMTEGLSWSADYTFMLDPRGDQLDLECWATVTNQTGADFPDAKIRFVAGSPNRAVRARRQYPESRGVMMDAAKAMPESPTDGEMAPQAMGELYAYPYESTATIRQDQMNRVRMVGSERVRVKRVYSVALQPAYYGYSGFYGDPNRRINATMGINLRNDKASELGMPLPAGSVRVYEKDKDGAARYVGAASLSDTPKDAPISLTLTEAFDVYARARQVSVQKIDKRHVRRTAEVVVNNEKPHAVDVRLVQNLGGAWRMESESSRSRRLDGATNEWTVTVPAGGETKLRYTAVFGP